jgi:hypothetical protein
MAVNAQVDMFEDLAPLAEKAFAMGEEAGMRGDTLANPFNESSTEGQEFAKGWHAGQHAIFAITKKREEAAASDQLIKGEGHSDEEPFADADNDDQAQQAAE